jgi:L-serine dehydratase
MAPWPPGKGHGTDGSVIAGGMGEVVVACLMAAAWLVEHFGGMPEQAENSVEIGKACDPIGGLVRIPCIERNAMGAVNVINASLLALSGAVCISFPLIK